MLAVGRVYGFAQPPMLDEPSLGLAPILVKDVSYYPGHNNEGKTVLLVEQNAYAALRRRRGLRPGSWKDCALGRAIS